jgi:hypothetical protein
MIRSVVFGLIYLATTTACASSLASEVEPLPWPANAECSPCLAIQVDELTLDLPTSKLARVITFGEMPGLHLISTEPGGNETPISIVRWNTTRLIEASIQAGLTVDSPKPTIGNLLKQVSLLSSKDPKTMPLLRLFAFDQAARITYSKKNDLEAYGYWNTPSKIGKVVVVLNGCDSVSCDSAYEILGDFSQSGFLNLLGGLGRRPPH